MPERINFTKRALNALPAPAKGKRAYYYDSKSDGLQVAVTSAGAKTFYLYKKIEGKPTRIRLGAYPDLTPELARKEADKARGQLATGKNPKTEKQRERSQRVTLAEAFEAFQRTRKNLKPKTLYDYRNVMGHAFGDWQKKRFKEITPAWVTERYAKLGRESGEAYANLAMRCLRSVWNFASAYYTDAHGETLLPANPVNRLSRQKAWFKDKRRQGYIRAHELPAWFEAVRTLQQEPVGTSGETVADFLLLLLFTGLRRGEAERLTWQQVDLQEKTLTIEETKNSEVHRLPLSDFLVDLLARRAKQAASPYVFPGRNQAGHLKEPRPQLRKITAASGITFTLHDLRRTFVTVAESLDIPAYALKRLVNHKMNNDVTAGYIVTDVERLRGPMQRITDFLLSAGGLRPQSNVVAFTPPVEPATHA